MDENRETIESEASDPFYSEANMRYLKAKLDAIDRGELPLFEHDLIEV